MPRRQVPKIMIANAPSMSSQPMRRWRHWPSPDGTPSGRGVADRVEFVQGDLLATMGAFDLIVANLPYVREGEWQALAPELREWEPRDALVGGERGTEVIERLLEQAAAHLRPGGVLALEIGDTQGVRLAAFARSSFPEADIHVRTDLAGLDRMLVVRT